MGKIRTGKSASSIVMLLLLLAVAWQQQWLPTTQSSADSEQLAPQAVESGAYDNAAIMQAFRDQRSNVQVLGQGIVQRVLPPDNDGNPHQRFIVRIAPDHTVLLAHNLTLAEEIKNLRRGEQVSFYGEYEWNDRGGVIHWTHNDPQGRHADGWIEYRGRRYQ